MGFVQNSPVDVMEAVKSNRELYVVQKTVPDFGMDAMLHIVVQGKTCGVPLRLNLEPGDVIEIHRAC